MAVSACGGLLLLPSLPGRERPPVVLFTPPFPSPVPQRQSLVGYGSPSFKKTTKNTQEREEKGRFQPFSLRMSDHFLSAHSSSPASLRKTAQHLWEMLPSLHFTAWHSGMSSYYFSGWDPWGRKHQHGLLVRILGLDLEIPLLWCSECEYKKER